MSEAIRRTYEPDLIPIRVKLNSYPKGKTTFLKYIEISIKKKQIHRKEERGNDVEVKTWESATS